MTNRIGITMIFAFCIWSWNVVKFASCDFESNFRCEIIHGVGVVVPPASMITVWFDVDK